MSVSSFRDTLRRIKDATTDSPIAVLRCNMLGFYQTVFADTEITREMILRGDPKVIGVYHGGMDLAAVRAEILG
jgi:hypothetical protein